MFVMSTVVAMLCWSASAPGAAWFDQTDDRAVQRQDAEPPRETAEADQKAKPGSHDAPACTEDRGEHRWEKMRHGPWRNFRDGRVPAPPPEMIDLAMEVLKEKLPRYYEEMTNLRAKDPARFERAICMTMPVVMEYIELRDHDQKLADTIIEEFTIEHELRKLSRDFKAAEGSADKQAGIEEEIRKLVRRQFDIRVLRQEARLEEFAQRLEQQQKELDREKKEFEERRAKLAELVASRVEEVKAGKMSGHFGPKGGGRHGAPGATKAPQQGNHGQGPAGVDDRPPPGPDGPPPPCSGSGPHPRPPEDKPAAPDAEESSED